MDRIKKIACWIGVVLSGSTAFATLMAMGMIGLIVCIGGSPHPSGMGPATTSGIERMVTLACTWIPGIMILGGSAWGVMTGLEKIEKINEIAQQV